MIFFQQPKIISASHESRRLDTSCRSEKAGETFRWRTTAQQNVVPSIKLAGAVEPIVINLPKESRKRGRKDKAPDGKKDAAKESPPASATDSSEDQEDVVRKKAEELVKRAQGADGKPGEDFAALARENSQDVRSKAAGGDIGWVNKKDKRETDDPLNRVFNMQRTKFPSRPRKVTGSTF